MGVYFRFLVQDAKIRVKLNQVRESLEECVRSLDLDRAQELKLELKKLEEEHKELQQQLATPAHTPRLPGDEVNGKCWIFNYSIEHNIHMP